MTFLVSTKHKIVKKILRSLPERFDQKVLVIEETSNLDSLKADQLVGNLQTFEANLRSTKKAKGMALVFSKSRVEHDDDSELDTEDPDLDAFFVKKFKKFLKDDKKGFKKSFQKLKGQNKPISSFKTNHSPKPGKNVSIIPLKNTHCYECKGFGHYASKCINRSFRTQGKVLNVTLDDDSDQDGNDSELESSSPDHGKFMAFMAKSNGTFVQNISDKSDDDVEEDLNSLDNEHEDLVDAYENLLENSRRMVQLNDILKGKWKTTNKENIVLRKELEEAQGKVSQLESQRTILTNKLIDVGNKCDMLHEQSVKAEKEIQSLKKDVDSYKAEKADMSGKL